MSRYIGRTLRQLRDAPQGALFVWVNADTSYPVQLAQSIQRSDLTIVGPQWFETPAYHGNRFSGIVVDHAVELPPRTRELILYLRQRWSDIREAQRASRLPLIHK